jgi:hypothetical protein
MVMAHEAHIYAALLQQIHDDLRVQHPDWIQPNGKSPMCDSYEARVVELLDASMHSAPNEATAVPDCSLEYEGSQIETATKAN